jgi:hypothetical protein
MKSSAVISECGTWRYRLDRDFETPNRMTVAFLLHNPSTADGEQDDPTSRRGIGFAKSWGAGRMVFVNPWAGRSTDPTKVWKMPDPVGPDNDRHIDDVCYEVNRSGGFIVYAWGLIKAPPSKRFEASTRLSSLDRRIRGIVADYNIKCLGTTKDGWPRHPLYLKGDTQLEVWKRKWL